jgi:hypothetical protein
LIRDKILAFLKNAALFPNNFFLFEKGICRNPPVPPFEKGGRRGDLGRPFQKAKFIRNRKLAREGFSMGGPFSRRRIR